MTADAGLEASAGLLAGNERDCRRISLRRPYQVIGGSTVYRPSSVVDNACIILLMGNRLNVFVNAGWMAAVLAVYLAACVRTASQAPTALPTGIPITQPGQTESQEAAPRTQAPVSSPTAQRTGPQVPANPPESAGAGPGETEQPALAETQPTVPAGRLVFRLPREVFAGRFSLDGNYQVFSADMDGSNLAPLTPGLGGDLTPLDVSGDGQVLVASGKALYSAGLDGSSPVKLAANYAGGLWETGAYWLAGGDGAVYIGLEGAERHIYRVRPGEPEPQRLTEPGWLPGDLLPSEGLEFVTWRQGELQNGAPVPRCDPACYARVALEGSGGEYIPEREFLPGEVEIAALAPATGLLAFHAENKNGWEDVPVSVIGPGGESLDRSEPLKVCSMAWSPDGRQLLIGTLYGEGFCGWYSLWAPGEGPPLELSQGLPSSYAQRWSPDGRWILFEDWSGVWAASLQEQAPQAILEEIEMPPGAATHILWVP